MPQPRETGAIVFTISGALTRTDTPALCERLHALLESNESHSIICDVQKLIRMDVATVEALARLQLTARQCGCQLRVRHGSAELQDLLALMGLSQVIPLEVDLSLQVQGQIEEREQRRSVEEEADPGDPTI